jgi:hypothetical protein
MSKTSSDELLENVKEEITGMDTILRRAVPAEEKLALTLRYCYYYFLLLKAYLTDFS